MAKQVNYIFSTDIDVRDYELDSEGIVNNANYLHYLEYTRHQFCRQAGLSFGEMTAQGIVPVVAHIDISYKAPLRSGDVMTSKLWLEQKGPKFIFHQDVFNKANQSLCVSAKVTVVSIENGRLSRSEKLATAFSKFLK